MNNNYKSHNITLSSLLVCYGVLLKCFIPKLPIIGGVGSVIVILMIISMHSLDSYNYTLKTAILIIVVSNFIIPDIIVFVVSLINMILSYLIIVVIKKIINNRNVSIMASCVICNTFVVFILFMLVLHCQYTQYYKYVFIVIIIFTIIGVVSGIVVNKILKAINK